MHLTHQRKKPSKTTSTLHRIPNGKEGTLATLKMMRRLAIDGKKSLPVRMTALELVRRKKQKDGASEVRALHSFVRDKIRYVKDIKGVETLHTPEKMLEIRQGDCDDKSTLLAAMLESIGHPARFVAVGFDGGPHSHVLVETKLGKKWIPLETTEPWPPGKYPPGVTSRMVIYV